MTLVPFPRIDVSQWQIIIDETSGVEEKMWLEEPVTKARWLYKPVTSGGGYVCGEDWAEKAVAEVSAVLGVSCAHVELAHKDGRPGSISRSLRPKAYDLQHGSTVMVVREVAGFVPGRGKPGRPGHSLENIQYVLEGALPPPDCVLPYEASAFDVFAGYLVLDALVANRDRHEENWAILVPTVDDSPVRLCGSYDHANSLGYNLTDMQRSRFLAGRGGIARWCSKGTAYRFEHVPGRAAPTLVETAARGLALASAQAREHWPSRLEQISEDHIRDIIGQISEMSEAARTFAIEVMLVNRGRILDACA